MSVTIMVDGQVITVPDDDPRVPKPVVVVPVVPQRVERRQGRLALLGANLLDPVEQAVAAADRATQIWYEDAHFWERTNPILLGLAVKLGVGDAQMDGLFTTAGTL